MHGNSNIKFSVFLNITILRKKLLPSGSSGSEFQIPTEGLALKWQAVRKPENPVIRHKCLKPLSTVIFPHMKFYTLHSIRNSHLHVAFVILLLSFFNVPWSRLAWTEIYPISSFAGSDSLYFYHLKNHCSFHGDVILKILKMATVSSLKHRRKSTNLHGIADYKLTLINNTRYKNINHLTPNGHSMGRTAQLTSRCFILYIYSTNIRTEYFKHAA